MLNHGNSSWILLAFKKKKKKIFKMSKFWKHAWFFLFVCLFVFLQTKKPKTSTQTSLCITFHRRCQSICDLIN